MIVFPVCKEACIRVIKLLYYYDHMFPVCVEDGKRVKFYLVSWHLHTGLHFLVRHEIRTNNYILLQFPKETNTRSSKTDTFYYFSHNFTVLINKA